MATATPVIALAGTIGAGKSTLAPKLGDLLGVPVYYEPVDTNPLLAKFYEDPKQYAFVLEMHLLNQRIEAQAHVSWARRGGVLDRSVSEDKVFVRSLHERGILSDDERDTYMRTYTNLTALLPHSEQLIVYLRVSPEVALQRIRQRGRDMEAKLSLDDLVSLQRHYDQWLLEDACPTPVLVVDYDELVPAERVAELVRNALSTPSHVRYPVDVRM